MYSLMAIVVVYIEVPQSVYTVIYSLYICYLFICLLTVLLMGI